VQHEQVGLPPERQRLTRGRDRDPGESGHDDRADGQFGDQPDQHRGDRSAQGDKHGIRLIAPQHRQHLVQWQAEQAIRIHPADRERRRTLRLTGQHRRLDEDQLAFGHARERAEERRRPLEVGVGVRDRDEPHGRSLRRDPAQLGHRRQLAREYLLHTVAHGRLDDPDVAHQVIEAGRLERCRVVGAPHGAVEGDVTLH
jgi:hypothetical protein